MLLFGHPERSSSNLPHFAAGVIFWKHKKLLHFSASNLPPVPYCFHNKAQSLQHILLSSAWFDPQWPLAFISHWTSPGLCIRHQSSFFPQIHQALSYFKPFAYVVPTCTSLINHYWPFRSQLKHHFWGSLPWPQRLALFSSVSTFIVSLSECLISTLLSKRQAENVSALFTAASH